jgi:hypothetical protein
MSRETNEARIERVTAAALELLKPSKHNLADCRAAIERDIKIITTVREHWRSRSPGKMRDQLEQVAKHARRLEAALRNLDATLKGHVFDDDLSKRLKAARGNAEHYAEALVSWKTQSGDPAKFAAVIRARALIQEFGDGRLSKTIGGAWNTLAGLIYEAVAGEDNADLTAYCRHPDRIAHLQIKARHIAGHDFSGSPD